MGMKSALSFILGAAIGGAVGVLFAPDKGKETRRKLCEAASEGYEDIKEGGVELAHDVQVRARYARRQLNDLRKVLVEQGAGLKEEARVRILAQLENLDKALSKDKGCEEEPQS